MKIVHCIFSFCLGGAETMLVDIMNRQCVDHDVTLIVVNNKYDVKLFQTISSKVKILKLERKPGAFPIPVLLKLNYLLRRLNYDVIHVHDHKLVGLIRGLDKQLFFTAHDMNLPLTYIRDIHIIAISNSVKADLEKRYNGKGCIKCINNGISVNSIAYCKQLSSKQNNFRIVNVGRLYHSKKGQHLLIQAVSQLRHRGYDVSVDFIGDGDSMDFLKDLSRELDIEDSVRFLGSKSRDYIYSCLCGYDLMCHPSIYEGFGLTVAEGIAAGLPVVVSTGDGPYEIIGQGKFGTAFENGNAEACAEAIKVVIDNYPVALQKAVLAREHVISNYSIEAMVKKYDDYYKSRLHRH